MNLEKTLLNIPQLKQVVDNKILDCQTTLAKEIRIIGLRAKIENRLETLNKIQTLLVEHEDVKTYETTCAGCGTDLNKDSLTEYCCNCM
tara:strand:- start:146 stop:412 length:267 start_codon:yes stop_codon:yes gene_type:complete